jgi:hypothetical protein
MRTETQPLKKVDVKRTLVKKKIQNFKKDLIQVILVVIDFYT